MPSGSDSIVVSTLRVAEHQPQIALLALSRLRWLAVIGQIAATVVAVRGMDLPVPIVPIAVVILMTAVSNLALVLGMSLARPPGWMVQAVLLFDVGALTALLYFTGGAGNPFASLYLVHVAMAVIALGSAWTWGVALLAVSCYGALFVWHVPWGRPIAASIIGWGQWLSLALVAILIVMFTGRVERALRVREQELADARDQAAKNEQLAALTTLAAGAAHELNTPLGTIAVVAKELEVSTAEPVDVQNLREEARLIRGEVDRCRQIINRLRLDIGDEAGPRRSVDVAGLVHFLRHELRAQEAARLDVVAESNDRLAAPAGALEQALLVLIRNAFDASSPHDRVSLVVERVEDRVRFTVEDRGAGMTQEQLKHAGTPFFTTKEPGKGLGLGLFLVRLVAERCGAQFSIDSRTGMGTRALLELPVATANNTRPDERTAQVPGRG